MKWFWLHK